MGVRLAVGSDMTDATTCHCYQCHRTRPAVTAAQISWGAQGESILCPQCLGLARLRVMRSSPADETPIKCVEGKEPGVMYWAANAARKGRVVRSGKEMS